MTYLRVTVGSQAYSSLTSINSAAGALAGLQAQLSSGNRIQRPSDDPNGTVTALSLRSGLVRNDQYQASADDALAWLSSADDAYSQMVDVLQQAQTVVLKGSNSGVVDDAARAALANQVDGLRASLLHLANTQYNGRPVFGGTTASGTAYDSSGAYVGDSGTVTRLVGPENQVAVGAAGPQIFGDGTDDVFSVLSQAATALRTDPSSLDGSLQKLTAATSRLSAAQAGEGAAYVQVTQAQTTGTAQGTALTTQLSGVEDIDLAEMAIKVATANTTYQAALQVTATVRQLSLLDFLK